MAIEKILTYDTELNEDIGYTVHPISLALGESQGHTIKVNVLRGGTKVTDSATCKGKFLRADGSTVEFNGTFSSGIASVSLPSSCYTKEGACKLSVYLVSGSQISCVFVLVANVLKYTSTEIVDTNQVVPNIETLLANVAKIEAIANDADVINKKVGHVEKSGNTILFYSDSTKSRLIASVEIPAGTGSGEGESVLSTDVQIDGTSITQDGVANIPLATTSRDGVVRVDSSLSPQSYNPVQNKAIVAAFAGKVDKVGGKGLSSNDYTDDDKAKVDAIPSDLDESLTTINAGLSELQNKDKSTQIGKVWGTTSDGAGWVDAPNGGSDSDGAVIETEPQWASTNHVTNPAIDVHNAWSVQNSTKVSTEGLLAHNAMMHKNVLTWTESTGSTDYAEATGQTSVYARIVKNRFGTRWQNPSDPIDLGEMFDVFPKGSAITGISATVTSSSDSTVYCTNNSSATIIANVYCSDGQTRHVYRTISISGLVISSNASIGLLTLNGSEWDMTQLRSDYKQKVSQLNTPIYYSNNAYFMACVQNFVGVAILTSTDLVNWTLKAHIPDDKAHLEASVVSVNYNSNKIPMTYVAVRHDYGDGYITLHAIQGGVNALTDSFNEISKTYIPASSSRPHLSVDASNKNAFLVYSINGRHNAVVAEIINNNDGTSFAEILTTIDDALNNYPIIATQGSTAQEFLMLVGSNGIQTDKKGISVAPIWFRDYDAYKTMSENLKNILTGSSVGETGSDSFTDAYKAKLDGIETGATKNTGVLTFTGAVNETFDGKTNKTINIPTGGADGTGESDSWELMASGTVETETNQFILNVSNPKSYKKIAFKAVINASAQDGQANAYFVFSNNTNAGVIKWSKHGRIVQAYWGSGKKATGIADVTPLGTFGTTMSQGSTNDFPSASTLQGTIVNIDVTNETIINTVGIQSQDGASKNFAVGSTLEVWGVPN